MNISHKTGSLKPTVVFADDTLPPGYAVSFEDSHKLTVLKNAKDTPNEKFISVYGGRTRSSTIFNLENLFGLAAFTFVYMAGRKATTDFTWKALLKPTESRKLLGFAAACFFASRYFSPAQEQVIEISRDSNGPISHQARQNYETLVNVYNQKKKAEAEAQKAAVGKLVEAAANSAVVNGLQGKTE